MAGFAGSRSDDPITHINVTPLVDIVLVLLIIFMVTAKLVVSRALPMDLPQAATGGEVQQVFAVSLAHQGGIRVDGATVKDSAALYRLAVAAHQKHPKLRAVIRADGSVPHRRVMDALDTLRQAEIDSVAFAVAPREGFEERAQTSEPAP